MALLVPSADAPAPVTSALKAWLRCSLAWCLAAISVVAGRQNTALSLAIVLAGNSVLKSRGNPAHSLVSFRPFGVLVPGAMGQPGARCREWAFDFGCPNK